MIKFKKKMRRHQAILEKETNVKCVSTPTKILAICNAGLVNGLGEEVILEHFGKFGAIADILLIPGKSCCFLSFEELESSCAAFDECNGTLRIAQDNKPIFMAYTEALPEFTTKKVWNKLPPGLEILENFISPEEEAALINLCAFDDANDGNMKHRKVKHYGFEFRYDINNVDKNCPLAEKIPSECDFIWGRLATKSERFGNFQPDQLTVNYYEPGQGIPPHVDTHSAFEDPLMSLSLGSSVVMDFRNANGDHYCVVLPRRSLTIIAEASRYCWTHGITPRKYDVIRLEKGCDIIQRGTRVSYTFRKVRTSECSCEFREMCDSFKKLHAGDRITEVAAVELEKFHVHNVYENIADHFSETRHKGWPNITEFVEALEIGSTLLDIGCGNGKYLGLNNSIFNLGCDRSFGLTEICKNRGFESFTTDCLNIPIRDSKVDAVICIAVIHHLATEERRLKAIEEIIRVLRLDGEALIYVWAKDQNKDEEKTSYLKQDRKNRKKDANISENNVNETIERGEHFSLPVHTNRTQFKHKDLLVPWKRKNSEKSDNIFLRYYHMFDQNELESLCNKFDKVTVLKSYYDEGNWCVKLKKIKT